MRISYLAISEKRCTVQIAGCNFTCRGCFSKERNDCGVERSGLRLARSVPKGVEVMLAGGEPTLDSEGLLSLIEALHDRKIILSTNGFLLDEELLDKLTGITVHIDLKALDDRLHTWYTGKGNGKVLAAIEMLCDKRFDFEVSTVYIPHVIETGEIEAIARFLSRIGDIRYKIMRYVPVGNFSRRPQVEEIENAVNAARKYLIDVTSSVENRSHPGGRKLITILPE